MLSSKVILVTPSLASEWLARNSPDQRKIRPGRVGSYAKDMLEGRWVLTHQGIAFGQDGQLIDGQHRLQAVVRANIPVRFLVTHGVELTCHGAPIDRGGTRTMADVLRLPHTKVAMTRGLYRLQTYTSSDDNYAVTVGLVEDTYFNNQEIIDQIWGVRDPHSRNGNILSAIAYALPVNPDAVLEFNNQIKTGAMLEVGSAGLAFRNWCSRAAGSESWTWAQATLNALRHHIEGNSIRSIYTTRAGYKWISQRRRALGIQPTPSANQFTTEDDN